MWGNCASPSLSLSHDYGQVCIHVYELLKGNYQKQLINLHCICIMHSCIVSDTVVLYSMKYSCIVSDAVVLYQMQLYSITSDCIVSNTLIGLLYQIQVY